MIKKKLFINLNVLYKNYINNVLYYYWFKKNEKYKNFEELPRIKSINLLTNLENISNLKNSFFLVVKIWFIFYSLFLKNYKIKSITNCFKKNYKDKDYSINLISNYNAFLMNNFFNNLIFIKKKNILLKKVNFIKSYYFNETKNQVILNFDFNKFFEIYNINLTDIEYKVTFKALLNFGKKKNFTVRKINFNFLVTFLKNYI